MAPFRAHPNSLKVELRAQLTVHLRQDPKGFSNHTNDGDVSSSSSSASSFVEIDWWEVSKWCQDYLDLPNSALDSLWYERLAEVAFSQGSKAETVLSLYRHSLDQQRPSWLCYRGMGQTCLHMGEALEAISQLDLALEKASEDDATPTPEPKDIANLHLMLGEYAYKAADTQKAAKHYQLVYVTGDEDQVKGARLGHLKATLDFPDPEAKTKLLRSFLNDDGGDERMVNVLKMAARDGDHACIMSKMFAVSMDHPDLAKDIVHAMERATTDPAPSLNRTVESLSDARFAENESRGVLLYYRGIVAHKYKVLPEDAEFMNAPVALWWECLNTLSDVGGSNSLVVRRDAIRELAKLYFQRMRDGDHLDDIARMSELDEADSNFITSDPSGLLGSLFALRGDKNRSRAALQPRIRRALSLISGPDIDVNGFYMIYCTLAQYGDLKNMAIAMSLWGQPDLVTEDLCSGVQESLSVDGFKEVAQETVKVVKSQVPDASQQLRRIEAAVAHADALLLAAQTQLKEEEICGEAEPTKSVSTTVSALSFLRDRLSALQEKHKHGLNSSLMDDVRSCDGRLPDGRQCEVIADFARDYFHCIYCSNRDFCGDCLRRLRDPRGCVGIIPCSPRHRWLKLRPLGSDDYVGPQAKTVQVREVLPLKSDENILEVVPPKDGKLQEIGVEKWIESLVRDWEILG